MDYNNGAHRTSGVAWIALFLAILAIIFAWVAFNRSGENLEDIVREEVREETRQMEQRFQQLELRLRGNTTNDVDVEADVEADEE